MLKILFENKDVIVCVKPHGVLSQSGAEENDGLDMLSAVSAYLGYDAGLLHRLDRPTGGIMAFSKNKKTEGQLSSALSDKEGCIKEYLAVVSGAPEEKCGELRDCLFKDAKAGKCFCVDRQRKGAKEAVLSYELLESAEGEKGTLSLIKIRLFTGRYHQIRAQFSSRQMPVVGDGKYGSRERVRGENEGVSPKDMIALYAYHLSLSHPLANFDLFSYPDKNLYPFSLFSSVSDGENEEK